jgi:AraC-like DNA-binding protein
MTVTAVEHRHPSADFVAALAAGAPTEGATAGSWPGLTFYRFTAPTALQPQTPEFSVAIVMQASRCLVVCDCPDRTCQIAEGSPRHPSLCLSLEIDPELICEVSASMVGRARFVDGVHHDGIKCAVATLDDELMSSALRFLRSLSVVSDRQVLAPLYLRELVYRVLQRDRDDRLTRIATQQVTANPVAAALDYIVDHLGEPLSVGQLAKQVNLSPSAFSRLFREVMGCSPYQFVKDKRLNRARELLEARRLGVTEVSRAVGYTSCSHFIKEFRARFGSTPGDYASVVRPTPAVR